MQLGATPTASTDPSPRPSNSQDPSPRPPRPPNAPTPPPIIDKTQPEEVQIAALEKAIEIIKESIGQKQELFLEFQEEIDTMLKVFQDVVDYKNGAIPVRCFKVNIGPDPFRAYWLLITVYKIGGKRIMLTALVN